MRTSVRDTVKAAAWQKSLVCIDNPTADVSTVSGKDIKKDQQQISNKIIYCQLNTCGVLPLHYAAMP